MRVKAHEGIQHPVVPGLELHRGIEHTDADAVTVLGSGGRVYMLGVAHDEVALLVMAFLVGERTFQYQGQFGAAMGVLRDAAPALMW